MSIVTWMSLNAARMVRERSWRGAMWADGGSCACERRQQRADRVGDFDGVAARLTHHLQGDGALESALPWSLV